MITNSIQFDLSRQRWSLALPVRGLQSRREENKGKETAAENNRDRMWRLLLWWDGGGGSCCCYYYFLGNEKDPAAYLGGSGYPTAATTSGGWGDPVTGSTGENWPCCCYYRGSTAMICMESVCLTQKRSNRKERQSFP